MDEVGSGRARRGNNRAGLDAAYETYAARLYDYCLWSTDDATIAEDAVHSALVAAYGREGLLRNDGMLRPWLYGAARNECIRALRKAGRQPKPAPMTGIENPAAKITALEELARVRRVTASFTRYEQDVAELALRHRLVPTEVAIVLGRPQAQIRTVILRVHSALSARCGEGVLLAFSSPPPPTLPEGLYARIVGSASIAERAAYFAERAGPYSRAGYPIAIDRPRPRFHIFALGASAACLATVVLIVALAQSGSPNQTSDDTPSSRPPLAVGPTFDPDGDSEPSPPASPESESPSPPDSTPSSTTPPRGTGATPQIRLSFKSSTGCPPTWTAQITAVVDGNIAREVRVSWWTRTLAERQIAAAAIDQNNYLTSVDGLPYGTEVFFRATAITVDNRTGQTGAYPVTAHCQ
jgi:DNA-directed RNA polymerase specialized sigma24 family protein